jgi:hypothetical protein
MKLIPMTDFVLEQWDGVFEIYPFKEMCVKCYDYANFLKQTLELWMFIPCDEEGNVLEEPKFHYTEQALRQLRGYDLEIALTVNKKVSEYQQAKERCLFDGFTFHKTDRNNPDFWLVRNSFLKIHDYELELQSRTIEILANRINLIELTPTAIKQLEL